jgi:iron complex outermembrane receptor protein
MLKMSRRPSDVVLLPARASRALSLSKYSPAFLGSHLRSSLGAALSAGFSGLIVVTFALVLSVPLAQADEAVAAEPAPAPTSVATTTELAPVIVNGARKTSALASASPAQSSTGIDRDQFQNEPAFSIAELLALAPGVTTLQGNGPRDVAISVRGSENRQTYGVRNIKVFEDGFPVTQPDGMARTDLTDPHAYGAIDITRGPSSAFLGNYATGGAIDFFTRAGSEIHGIELGADGGSNGYANLYATAGNRYGGFEYSAFASDVRGDTDTAHNSFITSTENLLATFDATPDDRLTFKFINNTLDTNLSIRLSPNQYQTNPYQRDCGELEAAGCASVNLYTNGYNGAQQTESAAEAGLGRHDHRTIVGGRWEHQFDAVTQLRAQATFDNRDISQPTSAQSSVGTYPSFNFQLDLIREGQLLGLPSTTTAGAFHNFENIHSYTYNVTPAGGATLGGLTQLVSGSQTNSRARLREALALAPQWSGVFGAGFEYTKLQANSTAYSYPANSTPTTARVTGDRDYYDFAPEAALLYQPLDALKLHARLAAGYGTPQATNLFITPQGVAGNNTNLSAQRNYGADIGAEWHAGAAFSGSVSGFYEFFRNELVSQSAGASLQSYTFNAPRSEHRGVEVNGDWHPLTTLLPGAHLALAYLYDNQIYARYTERLSAGSQSATFDRNGNDIPGVEPQDLNLRLIYDQPNGVLEGLGGFAELNYRESFFLDNADLLKAPGYTLVNLNLHYNAPAGEGWRSHVTLFASVQNLFDHTFVGSAQNISDSINSSTGAENDASVLANSTGSIYAGTRRLIYGGLRARF